MTKVRIGDYSGPINPDTTRVKLDGRLVENAIEADDEEGYVIVYAHWPPKHYANGDAVTLTLQGNVEFVEASQEEIAKIEETAASRHHADFELSDTLSTASAAMSWLFIHGDVSSVTLTMVRTGPKELDRDDMLIVNYADRTQSVTKLD